MQRFQLIDIKLFTLTLAEFGQQTLGLLLLAQWLQLVNGASAFESGLQLMPLALAAAVTSLLAPVLSERIGMRATVFLALFIAGAGMMVLGVRGENLELTSVFISLATTLLAIVFGVLAAYALGKFRFKGKSGKRWQLGLRDRRIARVIRACQDLPGQELFAYRDEDGIAVVPAALLGP